MKAESLSFRDKSNILSEKRLSGVAGLRYTVLYGKSQFMNDSCHQAACNCDSSDSDVDRREFFRVAGAGSAALSTVGSALPVMAGPFDKNEYLKIIPSDKKLDPAWIRSLYQRGQKETYSDPKALQHIGMPIGGLFTGTLYLSGDGRLWLWDIFNRDQEGIRPRTVSYKGKNLGPTSGRNYVEPAEIYSPFEQGFGIKLKVDGSAWDIPLNTEGFEKVTFNGQYPMATVDFESAKLPIKATLKACSPFIPLSLEDSSLPATIMKYTITNTSKKEIDIDLYGKLQNPICRETRDKVKGELVNSIVDDVRSFMLVNYNARGLGGDSKIYDQRDHGSMNLAIFGRSSTDYAITGENQGTNSAIGKLDDKLVGRVGTKIQLEPGKSKTVTFVISWYFPNFYMRGGQLVGHSYGERFRSALQVTRYVAVNLESLTMQTEKWVETWYDSTLPYWLLDRTMANTSTLATTTCYRFADGRFWAWEGIGCCAGTCTHVWHYAQAPGRIFPEVELTLRERTDFGIGQHDDGGIGMRTGLDGSNHPAHDGQCGRILGAYREHQMSADDAFLKRRWPNVKKAMQYLIRLDKNKDGLIEGAQPNTLDVAWYGKVSFLQSLYIAALKASKAMATEMDDSKFAAECGKIASKGTKTIEELYNGEYFVQIEDPTHKKEVGVGPGCYIDQIFGQSWAHQVGLGRLFDKDKQLSALRALWKYNFVPDVGSFRDQFKQGRWYAMAGDAGLLMCTWPKGGQNPNFKKHWQYMYFNECMSGFEWQVAAHMIAEGDEHPDLLEKGLAISHAIHDRYNAALRNPYNEIECSDHYARAMASYGVFIAASGFEYHGPKGYLAFAPRLSPENFKAAFTAAEGWGSYQQTITKQHFQAKINLAMGRLRLKSFQIQLLAKRSAKSVEVDGQKAKFVQNGKRVVIQMPDGFVVDEGKTCVVNVT